jgi:hypothetical protein
MKSIIISSGILFTASAIPALAYIDPITGSFILQALIGGFAAAAVAIKRVRVKILGLFGLAKTEDENGDDK